MRNPLIKRIPKEFNHDLGKYLAIFIFMVLFIGMISGFLVTDNSFSRTYHNSFVDKRIEDGHFALSSKADEAFLEHLSEKGNITIYPYFYFEEEWKGTEKTSVFTVQKES